MDTFSLVTGLATLAGLALQIFDLFPQFRSVRTASFYIILGIFVGGLIRAIAPGSIHLDIRLTAFNCFIGGGLLLVGALALIASNTSDGERRAQIFVASGAGVLALLFAAFFGTLVSTAPANLTSRELTVLVDQALQDKDYERAVMHLRTLEISLEDNDDAKKKIEERIKGIELRVAEGQ